MPFLVVTLLNEAYITGSRGDVFVVRTSKPVEIMGYFDRVDDRVTVSLQILYTANQETEGSQDRLTVLLGTSCLGRPSGDVPCASKAMARGY